MDERELKRRDMLRRMAQDEALFSKVIFPDHVKGSVPAFHRTIYELYNEGTQYLALAAPRGHAKSTITSLIHILYMILHRRARFVVLVSSSKPVANYFLDAIKTEIQYNDRLKYYYGDLKSEEKWTQDDIELVFDPRDPRKTAKIVAKGAGQQMRGLKFQADRPDMIVLDDIEDEDNTATKEQRKKLQDWFDGAVMPAIAPHGQILVIGTMLHFDSLLAQLTDPEQYHEFKSRVFKAIQSGPDGPESLWPRRFPLSKLRRMKRSFAARGRLHVFMQEYMNEPMNDELRVFKRDFIQHYKGFATRDHMGNAWLVRTDRGQKEYIPLNIYVGVDLAISQKHWADYTVIAVVGISPDNRAYLLEIQRDRMTPRETIDSLFDVQARFEPVRVAIEAQAYQKALIHFLREEMYDRNTFLPVSEVIQDHDKERRIMGMQPRFAAGGFLHRATMADFEIELLDWPKAKHDDQLDAIQMALEIAKRPQPREIDEVMYEDPEMDDLNERFGVDAWKLR